ncbi:MAG: hypothetical protein KJ923_04125 [Candidatus Omnitrophica bacterium]|nr:hypothetical protein [Candidatus Omnitrophota bacterium]MBU1906167.1 hypothetical protein [Candidatus Omnitrophota bacterium]
MIRDRQLLGNGGLDIGYLKPIKMSKTIFTCLPTGKIRNNLDFSDTSSIDDTLSYIKEQLLFVNLLVVSEAEL